MKKINVAELLKDCPSGMELDCIITNNIVTLEGVVGNGSVYPIRVIGKDGFHHMLTCSGGIYDHEDSKCVIFPKGKTTWEGFHIPFKDGDIVYFITENDNKYIAVFKDNKDVYLETYIDVAIATSRYSLDVSYYTDNIKEQRLATEEEKEKLFKVIKDNGYRWNPESKTLEKLIQPKFKVGGKI